VKEKIMDREYIYETLKNAFLSGKSSKCIGFRSEDWIGSDALEEMLSSFPIDIEWENYGDRESGKYDIVFSWDISPDTEISW
jgi:hypothetical protein